MGRSSCVVRSMLWLLVLVFVGLNVIFKKKVDIMTSFGITSTAWIPLVPALILGGTPGPDPETAFDEWRRAMAVPNVRGLVVGRSLLYPPDGDVAAAVSTAAQIVHPEGGDRRRAEHDERPRLQRAQRILGAEPASERCAERHAEQQARALGINHSFQHIGQQFLNFGRVRITNRFRWLAQHWMPHFRNFQDRHYAIFSTKKSRSTGNQEAFVR